VTLITCPECRRQISDQAPACIHCGYPIEPAFDEAAELPARSAPAAVVHQPRALTAGLNRSTLSASEVADEHSLAMLWMLAIVAPPVAIYLAGKRGTVVVINLVLTLFYWFPGVIHAMMTVQSYGAARGHTGPPPPLPAPPWLRTYFGFRSGVWWKQAVAILGYLGLAIVFLYGSASVKLVTLALMLGLFLVPRAIQWRRDVATTSALRDGLNATLVRLDDELPFLPAGPNTNQTTQTYDSGVEQYQRGVELLTEVTRIWWPLGSLPGSHWRRLAETHAALETATGQLAAAVAALDRMVAEQPGEQSAARNGFVSEGVPNEAPAPPL